MPVCGRSTAALVLPQLPFRWRHRDTEAKLTGAIWRETLSCLAQPHRSRGRSFTWSRPSVDLLAQRRGGSLSRGRSRGSKGSVCPCKTGRAGRLVGNLADATALRSGVLGVHVTPLGCEVVFGRAQVASTRTSAEPVVGSTVRNSASTRSLLVASRRKWSGSTGPTMMTCLVSRPTRGATAIRRAHTNGEPSVLSG